MSEDGIDRRRLAKWLIVVAVAIPVLVEGVTFGGLLLHTFGGSGDTASTPTPAGTTVGVGDELVEVSNGSATVDTAEVTALETAWKFRLAATVTNDGDTPLEIQLRNVTTDQGRRVSTVASSGTVAPGEQGSVTAVWVLNAGERPTAVGVTVVRDGERSHHQVSLAPVPVSSG